MLVDNEGIEHASAIACLELVLLPVAVAAIVAHAAAGRLASVRGILVAVALGAIILREPVGLGRVVGAVLVVAGVALVAAT